MKFHLIFIIGYISLWGVLGNIQDCNIPCSHEFVNWICRPDGNGCFYEFKNDCQLIQENCLRSQKGLQYLQTGTYTKCINKQTPICPNLINTLKKHLSDEAKKKEERIF